MSIHDKITAMIRQADESTHPAEADAFMQKVHALLEREGISMMDLGTLKVEDPLGVTHKAAEYTPMETSFRDVVFALAEFYGCKATIGRRMVQNEKGKWVKRHMATVYGRQNARTTFELMWPYVKRRMLDEAFKIYNEERAKLKAEFTAVELKYMQLPSRSVYMRHVATALELRITKMIIARTPPTVTKGENALVPVDLIADLMPKNLRVAKDTKKETTHKAMRAAENIGLDMQTEGSAKKQLRRLTK